MIGFDRFEATGRIMAELRRVRRRGLIRLVDVLFVSKDQSGSISSSMHLTDLSEDERMRLGAIAGGLIGLAVLTLFVGALRDAATASVLFACFGAALVCTVAAIAAFMTEILMAGRGVRDAVDRQKDAVSTPR